MSLKNGIYRKAPKPGEVWIADWPKNFPRHKRSWYKIQHVDWKQKLVVVRLVRLNGKSTTGWTYVNSVFKLHWFKNFEKVSKLEGLLCT